MKVPEPGESTAAAVARCLCPEEAPTAYMSPEILSSFRDMHMLEPIDKLSFHNWLVPTRRSLSPELNVMLRLSAVGAKAVDVVDWSPVGPLDQV